MVNGQLQVVDAVSVPFATESEHFNIYTPNVPESISCYGMDELGNPQIVVQTDTVVGLE